VPVNDLRPRRRSARRIAVERDELIEHDFQRGGARDAETLAVPRKYGGCSETDF